MMFWEGAEASLEQKHNLNASLNDFLFQGIVMLLQNFSFWAGGCGTGMNFYGIRDPFCTPQTLCACLEVLQIQMKQDQMGLP